MNTFYLWATLIVLIAMVRKSWIRWKDPLHPALFIAPLFGYSYVLEPWLLNDEMESWFTQPDLLGLVLLYNLGCVAAFAWGVNRVPLFAAHKAASPAAHRTFYSQKLIATSIALSLTGFLAYAYGLYNVGGFAAAYSRAKGGGHFSSGYIGEAINLGLVGGLFIGLARTRLGLRAMDWFYLFLGVAPNLLQGTFGGRRGPLFLSLGVIFLTHLLSNRERVGFRRLTISLACIGFAVLFVWSQRQTLNLGEKEIFIDWEKLTRFAFIEKVDQGNNFIYGTGHIITAIETGKYTWGKEILVNLFVRPIPRQLWPTKYEDVGAHWVNESRPGLGSFSQAEWIQAVGWRPFAGSSAGTASDLFGEFSWFAIVCFYFIGTAFSAVHLRHRYLGGVWTLLLLEVLCLSIYLATQSFSAFYHRFLVLAIPTLLVWRIYLRFPYRNAHHRVQAKPMQIPAAKT